MRTRVVAPLIAGLLLVVAVGIWLVQDTAPLQSRAEPQSMLPPEEGRTTASTKEARTSEDRLDLPLPASSPFARVASAINRQVSQSALNPVRVVQPVTPDVNAAAVPASSAPPMLHRYYGATRSPDGRVQIYISDAEGVALAEPGVRLGSGYVVESVSEYEIRLNDPATATSATLVVPTRLP